MMEIIHMSIGTVYQYKGVTFELHRYFGPIVLRRSDHEEKRYERISLRHWGVIGQFMRLSKKEQNRHLI